MAISKLLKANRTRKPSGRNDAPTGASDKQLVSVCHAMNDSIHKQIQKLVAKDAETPFDIATLDISEFLASLDPQVWKMIVLLTQSEIENKSVEVNCGEDDAHHREPSPNSSKVSEPCCLAIVHE